MIYLLVADSAAAATVAAAVIVGCFDRIQPIGDAQKFISAPFKGTLAVDGNGNGNGRDRHGYSDVHYYTRCSLWACFGWNGEDKSKRIIGVGQIGSAF